MPRTLALLRHGRALGHTPDAALAPAGLADVERLGRRLAAEGWRPAAACASPYRRAIDSARRLVAITSPGLPVHERRALVPEADPAHARIEVLAEAAPAGVTLVVAHLPLLALFAEQLLGDPCPFAPGSFVEIALRADSDPGSAEPDGRLIRRLDP